MMRVNLLFGFLGAGKTTLVRRLLAEPIDHLKTAVIVNEFGEVGVDGQILSASNVDILELTSGCLCCTLKGSLMLAIEELRAMQNVERIIVEATGVAQPGEMLETLTDPTEALGLDIGPLVTVVDTAKLPKLLPMLGEFYASQIENADIVVLNKSDLVMPDALEAANKQVRGLNARADILFAEQCDVDSAYLLRRRAGGVLDRATSDSPAAKSHGAAVLGGDDHEGHGHHAGYGAQGSTPADSFVLAASGDPSRSQIERFFRELADGVWRAKGYLSVEGKSCLVQYTMGQLEITTADPRPSGYVVFIGRGMDRASIESRFALAGVS